MQATDNRPVEADLKDQLTAARVVAAAVATFFVVYWAVQVQSAYSLLVMAYGG